MLHCLFIVILHLKHANYDRFCCMGSFMCVCLKTDMDLAHKSQNFFSCFKPNELDTLWISVYWI